MNDIGFCRIPYRDFEKHSDNRIGLLKRYGIPIVNGKLDLENFNIEIKKISTVGDWSDAEFVYRWGRKID